MKILKNTLWAICLLSGNAFAAEEKLLYLYNLSEYMPETVLEQFQ